MAEADVFQPDAALLPLLPPEDRAVWMGLDTSSQPDETILLLYGADFAAYNRAVKLMKDAGFTVGQSCAHQPTACMFGKWDWVAKWRNLTRAEQKRSHAMILGDHRQGPVSIALTPACPAEGREQFLALASDLSELY